jgi:hypothetical protein
MGGRVREYLVPLSIFVLVYIGVADPPPLYHLTRSMDMLYIMMLMGFKYQLLCSRAPDDILKVGGTFTCS